MIQEYKQVIIVRKDLGLPKGKLAAQAAHAAVEGVLKSDKDIVRKWRHQGMKKIVVKVEDDKELYKYIQQAKDLNLVTATITDAGRTVVEPGTLTCGVVGPDIEQKIDSITGSLKIL
jgi:PTH2 family peptidyl-tRNA hydrolase